MEELRKIDMHEAYTRIAEEMSENPDKCFILGFSINELMKLKNHLKANDTNIDDLLKGAM